MYFNFKLCNLLITITCGYGFYAGVSYYTIFTHKYSAVSYVPASLRIPRNWLP